MDTKVPPSGMLHGHTAVRLETRGQRKLTILLFIQSILTCACAALCFYILYKVHHTDEAWHNIPVDKGIYLRLYKMEHPGTYLNFTVTWNNSLRLEHGSEIMVPMAGPYVLYFCALVYGNSSKGNLTVSQGRTKISFELFQTADERCVRQQKVISLYEKEKVTFSFKNTFDPYLFLQELSVGLHYLLGAKDFGTPEYDPRA
ncbi:uncharacterized protein LOC113658717 [Tachysurus fulvidraco]|uniref:uncharacterized protein LOC113658717 n=1 Tax=Tachysurus fulvidraco TaxID=1234273 RepID=UPI000F4F66A0|nr:uncharacterized protein LOC113658717 [Tachysurus fulvidraco]